MNETTEQPEKNGGMWKSWAMVLIVILSWIGSALVQWGITSAHQVDTDRRVGVLEQTIDRKLDRNEYEDRQSDIINRLQRIENKIDNVR